MFLQSISAFGSDGTNFTIKHLDSEGVEKCEETAFVVVGEDNVVEKLGDDENALADKAEVSGEEVKVVAIGGHLFLTTQPVKVFEVEKEVVEVKEENGGVEDVEMETLVGLKFGFPQFSDYLPLRPWTRSAPDAASASATSKASTGTFCDAKQNSSPARNLDATRNSTASPISNDIPAGTPTTTRPNTLSNLTELVTTTTQ